MKKQDWDGRSFALGALLLWFGYRAASTAPSVTTKSAAVTATVRDELDDLFAEMNADIHRGFDNRLAFEAWADAR